MELVVQLSQLFIIGNKLFTNKIGLVYKLSKLYTMCNNLKMVSWELNESHSCNVYE